MDWSWLSRWPLLLLGLIIIAVGVGLADAGDPSDARSLLLGIGAVCVGAGIVLISRDQGGGP
jgi:hypothetical protein